MRTALPSRPTDRPRVRPGSPRRRGATLLEVLVAMLLLTAGLLGAEAAAAVATRRLAEARALERSADLAAGRLTRLRLLAAERRCAEMPLLADSLAVAVGPGPAPGLRLAEASLDVAGQPPLALLVACRDS
ncbi:MAG: prepilin-type N-terminal cleavage/methylation domain-containing protein [Gemmatimonadales bacterium]|nr:prepilin-type N-terminal cleavage/methylation domain-containing protein [Gemmatimonadales bacterium]